MSWMDTMSSFVRHMATEGCEKIEPAAAEKEPGAKGGCHESKQVLLGAFTRHDSEAYLP